MSAKRSQLARRVQVEPLDDERVTNLERKLVVALSAAPPPARARHGFAIATALVAAAAALLAAWSWHRAHGAPHAPEIARADTDAGAHVAVATDKERSTIAIDGASITSDPATVFDVTRGGGRVVVELARGRLDLAVQHQPGRTLIIHAGDTEIEDVGTAFAVAYDGAAAVDVRVREGEVKVTRDAHATRVVAGDAWTTEHGLVALAELEPSAAGSNAVNAGAGAGAGAIASLAPVNAPSLAGPAHIARVPDAIAAPPPAARVAHVAQTMPAAAAPAPRATAAAPIDPYVELRTAIHGVPIGFDPKIDGKADAAGEIAKLKLLAYSPTTVGAEASAALYRIAVLLHRPLEQDAAALGTLELYFRRFSGGKERTAALWLRVRVACGHKLDDACRAAAYSYQREVPTGDAADVAIRITNAQ